MLNARGAHWREHASMSQLVMIAPSILSLLSADGVAGAAARSGQQSWRDVRFADRQLAAGLVNGAAQHGHDADRAVGSVLPDVRRCVYVTRESALSSADSPGGRGGGERRATYDRH